MSLYEYLGKQLKEEVASEMLCIETFLLHLSKILAMIIDEMRSEY